MQTPTIAINNGKVGAGGGMRLDEADYKIEAHARTNWFEGLGEKRGGQAQPGSQAAKQPSDTSILYITSFKK